MVTVVSGTVVVGSGTVVVVVTGASVVVVAAGGAVVSTTVSVERGLVVTDRCGARVVSGVALVAIVVVLESTVEDVDDEEVDELLDVVVANVVEVGRAVVTGELVATCRLREVSPPVATSNSRAARAIEASA